MCKRAGGGGRVCVCKELSNPDRNRNPNRTYDGLSRMVRSSDNPSESSAVGIVGDSEHIGFVRDKDGKHLESGLVVMET